MFHDHPSRREDDKVANRCSRFISCSSQYCVDTRILTVKLSNANQNQGSNWATALTGWSNDTEFIVLNLVKSYLYGW
jgi:hypothetical protein